MRIPGFGERKTTSTTVYRDGDTIRTGDTVRADGTVIHPATETVRTHTTTTAPGAAPGQTYAGAITLQDLQRETHDAYNRGRKEERASRVNHPVLTILVVLLAILGLVLGVLALRERSFEGAGRIFDRWVGLAAVEAQQAGRVAQDAAGEAAQDTGQALDAAGQDVERDAEAARR